MKIALVHDFLSQEGGAERVLRAFHDMWPEAPVFTLFHDRERAHPAFLDFDVRTSFLQKLPGGVRHYRWYLPLMPAATESYKLSDFDVVLSSSSAFSKGVIVGPDAVHISYCHTPTRYLWTDTHSYVEDLKSPGIVKVALPAFLSYLRMWDRAAAERVDRFVANSQTVRRRIEKYYGRTADVIHPPVDTSSFGVAEHPGNYYLVGGRLVPYKRFDLVVRAFSKLGIPLKVFGEGPELDNLRACAKPNIQFLGKVDEQTKAELYRNCIAFIHPHVEDFGITAIEAMASGRPVIAHPHGGATETIVPGLTGEFLEDQSWENLAHHVIRFDPSRYDSQRIRAHAAQYDTAVFKEKMKQLVEQSWKDRETIRLRAHRPLV